MTEITALPIRGPLRYQVETSTPQIEAGREFSVFIRITNPYDVSATIKGCTTRLPAKFQDVEAQNKKREREEHLRRFQHITKKVLEDKVPKFKQDNDESKEKFRRAVRGLIRALPMGGVLVGGYDVAQYVTASTLGVKREVHKELVKPEVVEEIIEKAQESGDPSEALYQTVIDQLKQQLQLLEDRESRDIVLQPGNSTVQAFTLRTTQAILFVPSTYNLNLQIEYEIDGSLNQDSVPYQLNVRSPLKALIAGSFLGSLVGYLVRDIFEQKTLVELVQTPTTSRLLSWLIVLVGNVLIGALLVIAFARKKDAQPILSIEDFWGGVLIGFLAGYLGKSFLDRFIQAPVPSATSLVK